MWLMSRLRIAAAVLFVCAALPAAAGERSPAFVDAGELVPGLVVEMRYAGEHNFVGTRIDGYRRRLCLLTKPAAMALADVQRDLAGRGLGLKVFDCYRPSRAVAHFVRWAQDLGDDRGKAEFFPDVDKRDLFKDGYIAARSSHSRGSTVDITLVRLEDGKPPVEVDMGTPFDLFSPRSRPADKTVSVAAQALRTTLAAAMTKRGFSAYDKEWWHFTLADEPFPDTYFDFPVR
jgi:zinc D-Ala-D-Ala dipeptidase